MANVSGSIFYETLALCKNSAPGKAKKFWFKNKLLSLDSSTIALYLTLSPWAKFRRTKGAVKLHLLLDREGYLPAYAYISNGKKHDGKTENATFFKHNYLIASKANALLKYFGQQ